ncbi:uncharacterized protein LOC126672822 [Mercurialis annua]|uniref:uncharacterized protein LOC126672822 n=1 Tax=Mercurialis annua TaxID=3986 RepID=UPI002160F658|nr:uncharacterized protein LOC126672822 [Mercurialis annua]
MSRLQMLLSGFNLQQGRRDFLVWQQKQHYTSAVMFGLLMEKKISLNSLVRGSDFIRMIWATKLPPQVQIFHWLVTWDIISSNAVLVRRGIILEENSGCLLCIQVESSAHILLHCTFARQAWSYAYEIEQ